MKSGFGTIKKKIVICGQVWCRILRICALHLTHPSAHRQPEQWAAIAATPGVRCLAQRSHLSRGIKGGENVRCSRPPPTIPAGPEIQTHNLSLQVRRSVHRLRLP